MKYLNKRSSKRISPLMLAISVALILCMTVGGTIAYLAAQSESVVNMFTPSEVKIEIGEVFNGTEKKDVVITNTGDTNAYVKAMVVIGWKNGDRIIPAVEGAGADYVIEWGTSSKWSKDGDIYYYSDELAVGDSTDNLINSVRVINAAPEDGYVLHVEVIASAIQARPDAAKTDWQ